MSEEREQRRLEARADLVRLFVQVRRGGAWEGVDSELDAARIGELIAELGCAAVEAGVLPRGCRFDLVCHVPDDGTPDARRAVVTGWTLGAQVARTSVLVDTGAMGEGARIPSRNRSGCLHGTGVEDRMATPHEAADAERKQDTLRVLRQYRAKIESLKAASHAEERHEGKRDRHGHGGHGQ